MKKNKILIFLFIIIFFIAFSYKFITIQANKKELYKREYERKEKIKNIESHFNKNVITIKESTLYKKDNGLYMEYGNINKDVEITLKEESIDENTKYFYINNLDLYIDYKNVKPVKEIVKNDRYKSYIPFNKSIKTKNKTSFYDSNNKILYTINKSFDLPVIIKDNDKYGVEYNNQLLYIDNIDVDKIYDKTNTDMKGKNRIRVLTYHFIYDSNKDKCSQAICQSLNMFESHLKYIHDNNYFTLKLHELELYLDGKLQIPEKSIVLTIDDGTLLDSQAINLLEKYKANATLFVITGRISDFNKFKSNYLDLESHSDNMHNQYECKGYGMQGGGILCLPEEQVLKDLKTSQEKLGGSKYFAYPFFDFNDRAIELLKKAGFKLAFIGQYDTDGYSYPLKTDKYKVRRKTIFSNTSMNEFISYLQ